MNTIKAKHKNEVKENLAKILSGVFRKLSDRSKPISSSTYKEIVEKRKMISYIYGVLYIDLNSAFDLVNRMVC